MTGKELLEYVMQETGLDEATVKAVLANEKVASRASASLVQKKEYDDLQAQAATIELALNGNGKTMGAKAYQEWYQRNYPEIQKLQQTAAAYKERYGDLEAPTNPPKPNTPAAGATYTNEDIARMVTEQVEKLSPQWSNLVTGAIELSELHRVNGRKTRLDKAAMQKIADIAQTKGGDLVAAYNEWDAPEAAAAQKAATDAEVERRVKEGMQKAQTQNLFPAGADGTPSTGTPGITRPNADKKYDRNAVIAAAVTGTYDGKPVVQ